MRGPFAPGDVVVCVDARPDVYDPKADLLVERKTYRVAVVGITTTGVFGLGFDCLPSDTPGTVYGFSATRFRKIDDEVTDAFREQMRTLPKPDRPVLNPARHSRERV